MRVFLSFLKNSQANTKLTFDLFALIPKTTHGSKQTQAFIYFEKFLFLGDLNQAQTNSLLFDFF